MTAVRMYLLAVGVCSLVLGLAYVIRPVEMAALTEFTLPSPMAIIEIRAFYGGQLVGLGFAILLGLWDRRFVLPGLLLAAVPLAGTAAGRLYGVIDAGTFPPVAAGFFVLESATASIGGILLRREIAREQQPRRADTVGRRHELLSRPGPPSGM